MPGSQVQNVRVLGVCMAASIYAWLTCSTVADWPIAVPPAMTTSAAASVKDTRRRDAPGRSSDFLTDIASSFVRPIVRAFGSPVPVGSHPLIGRGGLCRSHLVSITPPVLYQWSVTPLGRGG